MQTTDNQPKIKELGCRICIHKYSKELGEDTSKILTDTSVICDRCFNRIFISSELFLLMDKFYKLNQESENVFSLVQNCILCGNINHGTSDHRCKTCQKKASSKCDHIRDELRKKFDFKSDDKQDNRGNRRWWVHHILKKKKLINIFFI